MATIKVRVNGEIATNLTPEIRLVCQNDKYDVEFEFDESWANSNFKTALFIYKGKSIAVPFDREQSGNVCKIPALYDTELLHIGVKSDDIGGLHTSTPARVGCLLSANDIANGEIPNPTPNQYDEIIALLNQYITGGGSGEGVDLRDYQKKVDNALETTDKTIVGAINEVNAKASQPSGGGLTEEEVKEIVQETAITQEADPTVPDWAKEAEKPTYTYEEIKGKPDLVEDIGSSLAEETNVLTIELKDKDGNVIATTKVALPKQDVADIDLTYYVKFTDYATESKAGVVRAASDRGIFALANGLLELVPATDTQLKNRAWYMPITGGNLDKAVKVGVTTNTETLTDEEKQAVASWIGTQAQNKPNMLVQRYGSGNIAVPLVPTADVHATSKKYVDGLIAELRAGIAALKG